MPDGITGSAMTAARLAPDGSTLRVDWDVTTCAGAGYHLLYGNLADVSLMTLSGGACNLGGGTFTWDPAPAGDLFFLVAADDGAVTEGSWGRDDQGGERSANASAQCGFVALDVGGTCP